VKVYPSSRFAGSTSSATHAGFKKAVKFMVAISLGLLGAMVGFAGLTV
jgi:hypothetical protein